MEKGRYFPLTAIQRFDAAVNLLTYSMNHKKTMKTTILNLGIFGTDPISLVLLLLGKYTKSKNIKSRTHLKMSFGNFI